MAKWVIKARGFVEIEVLLSSAFLAIIAGSFFGALVYSQQSLVMSGERERAVLLASEGIEATRAVRDNAMNQFVYAQSAVDRTSGAWELVGEGTDETLGDYTRTITYTDVCRTSANVIAPCPADYTDPGTIQVDVTVAWTTLLGVPQSMTQTTLLTDWSDARFTQTDWSGGAGQAVWSDEMQYDTDNGAASVTPSGQVELSQVVGTCGPVSWTFDSAGSYTYDTEDIEVTGGVAQLVSSSSVSGFASPVIDDYEFEPSGATDTYLYPVSGDVYAVVHRGSGNDGFVQTVEVDAAGTITSSVIDSLEFDNSSGYDPQMVRVTGDIFAIAYEGPSGDGYLVTVEIDSSGNISGVLDSEEFDSSNGETPTILNTSGSIVAIAYEGSGSDGFIVTYSISGSGAISSQIDGLEFAPGGGTEPDMVAIDSDTFAIAYQGSGNDGYLTTVDIDGSGNISSVINTYEYDASQGLNPSMLLVGSSMVAIAYEDSGGQPGNLVTIAVSDSGAITSSLMDSLVFEGSDADGPEMVSIGQGLYAIAYEGISSDGFMALVDIEASGSIGSVIDTLEFAGSNGEDIGLVWTGSVLIASYDGPGTDGYVTTIGLASTGGYPTTVPSIEPTTASTVSAIDQWTSFTETATKNGGEVYYQLSNDGGTTWYYWNGAAWALAAITNYSTAADVNSNIWAFPIGGGSLMVRAFLESDGTQQVQLDQIDVTCATFQTEVGQVSVDETWTKVALSNTYTSPVIVASHYDPVNTLPASTRVRNVDEDSFEIRLHNPSGTDIGSSTVTYWVVEEGVWTHNTVRIEAATHSTSTVGSQSGGWSGDSIGLRHNFVSAPLVFHQVMTDNDTGWISSFVSQDGLISSPPSASGFWLALNGAEVTSTHASETIGYIAVDEVSTGAIGSVAASFENEITPDTIQGVSNGCYNRTLSGVYVDPPVSIVSLQEMDGNNGGWALQCNATIALVGIQIDEDQVGDGERSHTTETAAWMAFDDTFTYSSGGAGGTGGGSGGSYVSPAEIISSAFDMGGAAAVESIEWDEDVSGCTGTCDIQLQLRAAPDNAGAPGTWSDWYGSGGSGTYFTEPNGTRVSTDLNENQWLQYRLEITSDGSSTPTLEEVRVHYRL